MPLRRASRPAAGLRAPRRPGRSDRADRGRPDRTVRRRTEPGGVARQQPDAWRRPIRSRLARASCKASLSLSTSTTARAARVSLQPDRAGATEQIEKACAAYRGAPCSRMLNSASRARSLVGRIAWPVGERNRRPLNSPAMMRTTCEKRVVAPDHRFSNHRIKDRTTLITIDVVSGIYARKLSRSITMSPGSRPRPSLVSQGQSSPAPIRTTPRMMSQRAIDQPRAYEWAPHRSVKLPLAPTGAPDDACATSGVRLAASTADPTQALRLAGTGPPGPKTAALLHTESSGKGPRGLWAQGWALQRTFAA